MACFIDGCFWHQCAKHYVEPKSNSAFWQEKLAGNRQRDRETDAALASAGWTVLRFWEHEPPDQILAEVERIVGRTA